jgi:endoglucanase
MIMNPQQIHLRRLSRLFRPAILLPLLLVSLFGSGMTNAVEPTPSLPSRLRGVNISGDGAVPSVARQVAAWGGNCIRVNLDLNKGYDEAKAPADEDALAPYSQAMALLRAFLPVCHELGMNVIICPSGIPGRKLDVFWGAAEVKASARANLTKFWKAFAQEFKGDPAIVAYDVFNEPNYPAGKAYLWNQQMLPDAVGAIRAINPGIWLIVEPGPWGQPTGFSELTPLADPHVIYSFHEYGPHNFTHQGVGERKPSKGKLTYPGMLQNFDSAPVMMWDRAALRNYMQPAIDFTNKYHVRMLVGEFGVARWAPGRDKWVEDNISIFEEQGWDWLFHSVAGWNGWNPTFSPEAPVGKSTEEGGVMTLELQVLIKGWALNGKKTAP